MFLRKLYRDWRPMFWCLILLIAGQFFFMIKGIENLPFFLYHMYGKPHPVQDSIAIYQLRYDGKIYNTSQLSNREEELLMNSIGSYMMVKSNNNIDPIDADIRRRFGSRLPGGLYHIVRTRLSNSGNALDGYPDWWSRYFRSINPTLTGPFSIVQRRVAIQPPFGASPQDSVIFSAGALP